MSKKEFLQISSNTLPCYCLTSENQQIAKTSRREEKDSRETRLNEECT